MQKTKLPIELHLILAPKTINQTKGKTVNAKSLTLFTLTLLVTPSLSSSTSLTRESRLLGESDQIPNAANYENKTAKEDNVNAVAGKFADALATEFESRAKTINLETRAANDKIAEIQSSIADIKTEQKSSLDHKARILIAKAKVVLKNAKKHVENHIMAYGPVAYLGACVAISSLISPFPITEDLIAYTALASAYLGGYAVGTEEEKERNRPKTWYRW